MSLANKIVDKLIEADLDDPKGNLDRHAQDIYQQRRFGGKLLAFQPESTEAIAFTHFDCWSDAGDGEDELWDEFDPRSVGLVNRLAQEWAQLPRVDGVKLERLAAMYPHVGLAGTMSAMADVIVAAGYSVYISDSVFEVYRPEDLAEEENVSVDEEEDRLNDIP